MLKERRAVWADENGKLDFSAELVAVAKDARVILSRDIRHGILKLTPEKHAQLTTAETITPV
jgi:glycerol-3-phosphate O-acyltransferase